MFALVLPLFNRLFLGELILFCWTDFICGWWNFSTVPVNIVSAFIVPLAFNGTILHDFLRIFASKMTTAQINKTTKDTLENIFTKYLCMPTG